MNHWVLVHDFFLFLFLAFVIKQVSNHVSFELTIEVNREFVYLGVIVNLLLLLGVWVYAIN